MLKEQIQELKKKDLRNLQKHQVLRDNVLLVPVSFDTDGVVFNPNSYDDKPEYGMIVAVGELVKAVKAGDFILFEKYSALKLNIEGADYIFIREENIISKYDSTD